MMRPIFDEKEIISFLRLLEGEIKMQQILNMQIIKAKIVNNIPPMLCFLNGFCLGALFLLFAFLYANNAQGLIMVIIPIEIVVISIQFGFIYMKICIK